MISGILLYYIYTYIYDCALYIHDFIVIIIIVVVFSITDLSLLVALAKHDHCGDFVLPDHPPELFRSIDTHRPCQNNTMPNIPLDRHFDKMDTNLSMYVPCVAIYALFWSLA